MKWFRRRNEGATRSDVKRHLESANDRLRDVGDRSYDYGDEDPDEVEARLRNMVYGTNGE